MIVMIVWMYVWKIIGKGIGTDWIRMLIRRSFWMKRLSFGFNGTRWWRWWWMVTFRRMSGINGSGRRHSIRLTTGLRISVACWICGWKFVVDIVKVIG